MGLFCPTEITALPLHCGLGFGALSYGLDEDGDIWDLGFSNGTTVLVGMYEANTSEETLAGTGLHDGDEMPGIPPLAGPQPS